MEIVPLRNWFSVVGQSWLDSLKIFLPQNFKLFLMASLNAMKYALIACVLFTISMSIVYLLIFKGGLLLIATIFKIVPQRSTIIAIISELVAFTIISFGIAGLVWLVRPSTAKKNLSYLKSGFIHLICAAVILMPFLQLYLKINFWMLDITGSFLLFNQIVTLFLLFWFDQKPSIMNVLKAFKKTFLLFMYNLPALILILLFYYFLPFIFEFILKNVAQFIMPIMALGLFIIFFFLFCILFICMHSVFYTKRVHEQCELYF